MLIFILFIAFPPLICMKLFCIFLIFFFKLSSLLLFKSSFISVDSNCSINKLIELTVPWFNSLFFNSWVISFVFISILSPDFLIAVILWLLSSTDISSIFIGFILFSIALSLLILLFWLIIFGLTGNFLFNKIFNFGICFIGDSELTAV